MATQKRTRGERNNNPLNIRHNEANKWKGLVGHDPQWFCIFDTLQDGINAAARCIYVYMTKHNLDTIPLIISRWAPGSENDVEAYIKTVCRLSGCNRTHHFEPTEDFFLKLLPAMARVESQIYLNRDQIREAYRKAVR